MSDDKFRDWIPEGEDTGAISDKGFQDFVPGPSPEQEDRPEQPVGEPEPEVPQEEVEYVEPVSDQHIVPPLEPEKKSKLEQIKDAVTGAVAYKEDNVSDQA